KAPRNKQAQGLAFAARRQTRMGADVRSRNRDFSIRITLFFGSDETQAKVTNILRPGLVIGVAFEGFNLPALDKWYKSCTLHEIINICRYAINLKRWLIHRLWHASWYFEARKKPDAVISLSLTCKTAICFRKLR